MARSNLELVQAVSAPWRTGDFSAPAEWADPEIEWVLADGPAPGSWKGVEGMLEGWRDFLSAWEEWRGETEEWLELDDERVLSLFHFKARGKASGLDAGDMWTKGALLFHVREERITRLVLYLDRERALTDLGLAPGSS